MLNRLDKVNSLIKKEVATLLHDFVEFKKGTLVTITKVETSIDLYYATVYISALPKSQQRIALEDLNKNIMPIQHALNKKLVMKYVPQLRFKIDEAEELQAEVDRIFHEEMGKSQHRDEEGKEKKAH